MDITPERTRNGDHKLFIYTYTIVGDNKITYEGDSTCERFKDKKLYGEPNTETLSSCIFHISSMKQHSSIYDLL